MRPKRLEEGGPPKKPLDIKIFLNWRPNLSPSSHLETCTLNTARSALSSILRISDCDNCGSHPLVVRFIKGVFEKRKPQPKYDDIWDASKVLDYLSTLHPVRELSLKDLTLKVLMLLLLVTSQREESIRLGESIHLMTLSAMKLTESFCQFQILDNTKTSKPGHSSTSITISEFKQDTRICPMTALKEYLDRTQGLRNGEQCLFISYVRPHRAVSKDTISRWAKSVLESSGIDFHKFSPHRTRAAAASKAKQKGADAQQRLFASFMISLLYLLTKLWHLPFSQSSFFTLMCL